MSLSGLTIAISGTLSKPRPDIEKLITSNGGTFSSSVTKKVTHLIVADPTATTTKIEKARRDGTKIVSEEWLTCAIEGEEAEESETMTEDEEVEVQHPPARHQDAGRTPREDLPLSGMIIALTGRLSKNKEEYAQIIASNGGTFSNTVTKKVTHVVAKEGDAASSKLDKARKYGATVVGEDFLSGLALREREEGEETVSNASETKAAAPPKVLLANKFDSAKPPKGGIVGWWVSEKLDGVRAWWDGEKFWSRLGNMFYAPQWFRDAMPSDCILDGELFMGRGKFQETISIVRSQQLSNEDMWRQITFMVFDIPSEGKRPFEERMHLMKAAASGREFMQFVEQRLVTEDDDIDAMLAEIEEVGGEGLMLRQPKSKYAGTRSNSLLKIKPFKDDEAKVVGYATEGKGRLKGMTGSLQVVNREGKKFKVGSGLSDEDRRNPPAIGTIITYRYQELTNAGLPRFPTYVGVAIDKEFP